MTGDDLDRLIPGLASLQAADLITPTGLNKQHLVGLSFGQYERLGAAIATLHAWTNWALGDLLIAAEANFGQEAFQLADALGHSPDGLVELRRVAANVPRSRRRVSLSWSHHRAVASMPPDEQTRLLDMAEANALSVHDLRAYLREPSRDAEVLPAPPSAREVQVEQIAVVAKLVVDTVLPTSSGEHCVPGDLFERLARAVYPEPET